MRFRVRCPFCFIFLGTPLELWVIERNYNSLTVPRRKERKRDWNKVQKKYEAERERERQKERER